MTIAKTAKRIIMFETGLDDILAGRNEVDSGNRRVAWGRLIPSLVQAPILTYGIERLISGNPRDALFAASMVAILEGSKLANYYIYQNLKHRMSAIVENTGQNTQENYQGE